MNRLSAFARRLFGKGINAADASGVAIRNTTPNLGKLHAERSRVFHASREMIPVHDSLRQLGFPPFMLSKGRTYRKEKV